MTATEVGRFDVTTFKTSSDPDDTNSIRRAVKACCDSGGGVVYFPTGKYVVSATIKNDALVPISLIGAGSHLSVLAFSGTVGNAFALRGTGYTVSGDSRATRIVVQGLSVLCDSPQSGAGILISWVLADGSTPYPPVRDAPGRPTAPHSAIPKIGISDVLIARAEWKADTTAGWQDGLVITGCVWGTVLENLTVGMVSNSGIDLRNHGSCGIWMSNITVKDCKIGIHVGVNLEELHLNGFSFVSVELCGFDAENAGGTVWNISTGHIDGWSKSQTYLMRFGSLQNLHVSQISGWVGGSRHTNLVELIGTKHVTFNSCSLIYNNWDGDDGRVWYPEGSAHEYNGIWVGPTSSSVVVMGNFISSQGAGKPVRGTASVWP